MTPISLRLYISLSVEDRRIVIIDHLYKETPYGESNGHVTDDVAWPQKVKALTRKSSRFHISITVQDKRMVTMDHQYETTYAEYNGHVTDDVTWPQKVKVVTPTIFEAVYITNGAR